MEKISRIIPASARSAAGEVSRSQPARPGAPEMGRVSGRVTSSGLDIEDRVSFAAAERASGDLPPLYKKTESTRAKVVDDLARKFFDAKGGNVAIVSSERATNQVMGFDEEES